MFQRHDFFHTADISGTALRQLQGLYASVKKLTADAFLNPPNGGADRRLGNKQLLRRFQKASLFVNLIHIFHSLKNTLVHKIALSFSIFTLII